MLQFSEPDPVPEFLIHWLQWLAIPITWLTVPKDRQRCPANVRQCPSFCNVLPPFSRANKLQWCCKMGGGGCQRKLKFIDLDLFKMFLHFLPKASSQWTSECWGFRNVKSCVISCCPMFREHLQQIKVLCCFHPYSRSRWKLLVAFFQRHSSP